MKKYCLFLPVYKQGDELAGCLKDNKNEPVKSFLDLAEVYDGAAQVCRDVAEALKGAKNVEVYGDTHYIGLTLPDEVAKPLVANGLLIEEENEEEEYDEEGEDESEDEEEVN